MLKAKLGAILCATSLVISCESTDGGSRIGGDDPSPALSSIKVNLPPSPSFQKEHAPETYPDSAYSVYGLRKNAKAVMNKEVRVKGFLTEVYECPPCPKGATCKTCDKPHFFVADRASGPKDEALMVTDYPREDPKTKKKAKPFEVGTQHYVVGTFATSSPTGFSNSDGLLIYKEAKRVGAD